MKARMRPDRWPTRWVWLLGALITLGDGQVGLADRFVARAVNDLAGLAADGRRLATTLERGMTRTVAEVRHVWTVVHP